MSPVINSLEDLEEWQASQRPPEPTQACTKCQTEHPVSHFRRSGPGKQWSRCEACREPARRHGRRGPYDPEQTRRSNLRRLYGITPEQYDAMREAQGFRCAICRRHEDELISAQTGRPRLDGKPNTQPMKLHVDHDHSTNEIRGLLCWPCNLAIGCFEDQADRMTRAITYVTAGGFKA